MRTLGSHDGTPLLLDIVDQEINGLARSAKDLGGI
jgi:hypothetical protein